MSHLDRVRAYYDACNTGDAAKIAAHFTDDAEHLFTRLPPVRGAGDIGEQTAYAVERAAASWHVEHGIESRRRGGHRVRQPLDRPARRRGEDDRGTEWFRFSPDGRIEEVRAYYFRDGLLRE